MKYGEQLIKNEGGILLVKTFDIVLDLEKDLYSPSQQLFTLSQSDVGTAEFIFHIMQDDQKVNLMDTTVQLGIKRPSGSVFYQDCDLTDAFQGEAQVLLASPAYVDTGIYYAEVYIKDTEGDVSVTCPFYFGVREALTPPTTDPSATSVNWTDVLNKPSTFPPSPHTHVVAEITDFATGVAANIPAEYLTQTEADTLYAPAGTTGGVIDVHWGEIGGDLVNQVDLQNALNAKADEADLPDLTPYALKTDIPPAPDLTPYLTEAEGDARYQAIGTEPDLTGYLTTVEGDNRYQQLGMDTPDDWSEITGKPTEFPPSPHTHTAAQITDFAAAVAADIPAEYLTQTEGDARYNLKGTSGTASSVDWGNVTGTLANQTDLQNALDSKANTTDIPDLTGYLTTSEGDARYEPIGSTPDMTGYLTQTDGDARYQQIGTDTPDDWAEITGKPTEFPPAAHTHAIADVTGLQAALDGKADDADLTGLLSQTDADARYQQIGTDTPDDWADITGKPTTFPPSAHTHAIADVTGLQTALDGKVDDADLNNYQTTAQADTKYKAIGYVPAWGEVTAKPTTFPPSAHQHTSADVTDFASAVRTTGDPVYQTKGTYLTAVPLMSGAAVGGAQVGNGLAMSGNYLYVKTGAGLGIDTNLNAIRVQTTNATPTPVNFWMGIQTDYDALANKDPNTLYFITG